MGFRLVPKTVTLNDLEPNGRVVCVISPNSVALGPYYAKVVEDTRIHSASEMYPKNLVLAVCHSWRYSQGIIPAMALKCSALLSLAKILHIISRNLEAVQVTGWAKKRTIF